MFCDGKKGEEFMVKKCHEEPLPGSVKLRFPWRDHMGDTCVTVQVRGLNVDVKVSC